ncbi:hypothetical protein D3C84_1117600 [compost metagenome]
MPATAVRADVARMARSCRAHEAERFIRRLGHADGMADSAGALSALRGCSWPT